MSRYQKIYKLSPKIQNKSNNKIMYAYLKKKTINSIG